MNVEPRTLDAMRRRLARVCAPERLSIEAVSILSGATPVTEGPAILCRVRTSSAGQDPQALHDRLCETLADHFPAQQRVVGSPAALAAALAGDWLSGRLHLPVEASASADADGLDEIRLGAIHPAPALQALTAALVWVGAALADDELPIELLRRALTVLDSACAHYGPTADGAILIKAARKRNMPFLQAAEDHALWQFGWGCRSNLFWVTSSNADGLVAWRLSSDKAAAKQLFRQLGMPTPASVLVPPRADFRAAARSIGWPCVVKPLRGGAGRGVTANIRDERTLDRAVALARRSFHSILIEAHEPGEDHRLMVIDGKLVAAVRREQPFVTADGRSTLAELILAFNRMREEGRASGSVLLPVDDDELLDITLATQGLARTSVPSAGMKVVLRTTANRSSGGTCTDVLGQVHPQVRQMAEQLTVAIGYRATGLDYLTRDISRSHDEVGGAFLEANSTPGIKVLLAAGIGEDEIGGLVLGTTAGRVPVSLVVAPADAQEKLAPLVAERLRDGEGAAGIDWAQLGAMRLPKSGLSAAGRVTALLRYPTLERLAILWTFAQLESDGLPVDALAEAIIVGPELPKDWMHLLGARSARVVAAASAEEALDRALASESPARLKRKL